MQSCTDKNYYYILSSRLAAYSSVERLNLLLAIIVKYFSYNLNPLQIDEIRFKAKINTYTNHEYNLNCVVVFFFFYFLHYDLYAGACTFPIIIIINRLIVGLTHSTESNKEQKKRKVYCFFFFSSSFSNYVLLFVSYTRVIVRPKTRT